MSETKITKKTNVLTMQTNYETIASRVKARREQLGLSQRQLANLCGLSQSTVGNIEAESRKQPNCLPRIARALGVRTSWLLDGENPMLDITCQQSEKLLDWPSPHHKHLYETLHNPQVLLEMDNKTVLEILSILLR